MSDHLAVLCHGLWGNPDHLWYVKKALAEKYPKITILVSDSNEGNRTYDGIDVCGERIAKEVRDKVEELSQKGTDVKKISFVGYSLGGLSARYAIGVLHSDGLFDKITPMSYTTFATPHLGVSPTSGGFFSWLVSNIGPKTLSMTGAHIFLADSLTKKRPLLEAMADEKSPFYQGLSLFKCRAAYANIANDRSVPYFTASIKDTDPYADLTKLYLNHDEAYGGTILNTKEPFTDLTADQKPQPMATLTSREIIFRSVMIAGLPLWVTLYSANAMIANYKSSQRISSHRAEYPEEGNSVLSKLTQDVVEEVMDDSPADATPDVVKLNPPQSKIVKSLNQLEWHKFDVHIRKTQHSHAAIVCRSRETERLTEGHDVMEHWLDNVFLQ